jgi:hypothetical protein
MAKQPKTKTDIKTKKPEAVKAETLKSETPKSGTTESTSGESTSTADSSATSGKKSSAPSRSISYFSSVASEDYRSGWDSIFGSEKKKSAHKPTKPAAARKNNDALPLTITLDADDLDPTTRKRLESVFRLQTKKKRLNYDKLSGNGQVSWQIACRISKA